MAIAGLLASMLGLSLISDSVTRYIRRHAVHVERYAFVELPRWLGWGTRQTGFMIPRSTGKADMFGDPEREFVELRQKYVVFRVPGWYWERRYWVQSDREEWCWCRRYLIWHEPHEILPPEMKGWAESYVSEREMAA